jgi:hypothetical protein
MSNRLIGIECNHGFGDCIICMPLIEALCKKHDCKAVISTINGDAFINVPFVEKVVMNTKFGNGHSTIKSLYQIEEFYQVTPEYHFYKITNEHDRVSLLNLPIEIGKKFDVEFDNIPKIYLTEQENEVKLDKSVRNVLIEAEYYSSQSWSNFNDFENLIKNNRNVNFHWLSIKNPEFSYENIILSSLRHTRRECISMIKDADLFISVGSGIFCGMIGNNIRNIKTVMLWNDYLYKYKKVLSDRGFNNITWIDNRQNWEKFVNDFK